MRVVYILVAVIFVLGWLSFETRASNRGLSQVLAAFAIVFTLALVTAAIGLY